MWYLSGKSKEGHEHLSHDSLCPYRDSNWALPEWEPEAPPSERAFSTRASQDVVKYTVDHRELSRSVMAHDCLLRNEKMRRYCLRFSRVSASLPSNRYSWNVILQILRVSIHT
jgi:hypothetical protein